MNAAAPSPRGSPVFERASRLIARLSARRPGLLLALLTLASVPAVLQLPKIRLDTDLARLLPKDSRAVRAQQELEGLTGDGGYFSMLFESDDPARLPAAVDEAVARVQALPEVQSVEWRHPVAFLRRYRYALATSRQLQSALERVESIEREVNPLVESLDDEPSPARAGGGGGAQIEAEVKRYLELPERHQSEDGRVMGLIVRPRKGVTSLGSTRELFARLSAIADEVRRTHGLAASGVAGSLRNKVDTYDQIRSDLSRGGMVSSIGILLALFVTFRSLLVLPIVLLPLAFGLCWSYGLVPALVGDLNTITAFLLTVLLGLGVEFAIHLVKRFQAEIGRLPVEEALFETLRSTGRSILVSGCATTFGMAILVVSRFRGFSEFGLISGLSILSVFLAIFVVLPPALALGTRLGLVPPESPDQRGTRRVPGRVITLALLGLAGIAAIAAAAGLSFDYNFSSLTSALPGSSQARALHRRVYTGVSAPSALYVARDLDALDAALSALERRRDAGGERVIGTISSVRDLVPGAAEWAERRRLLAELRERVAGAWTRRVEDETQRRLLADLAAFEPPSSPPALDELPVELRKRLRTRDDSGFVLAVDTAGRSRDGLMTMAFTRALYDTDMPEGVRGPTGDKPVLAEILWLVTREGPWLVVAAFLGVVLMVLADRRSLVQAFWVLLPLCCGLAFCLGGMLAFGWRFNFFNVIVLPNVIGNAVDNGVHYFRRWQETAGDTAAVQEELAGPVTASTVTTVMGYAGMLLAHHAGLRAIASLASWGLVCCWFAGVTLMPGVLRLLSARQSRQRMQAAT